MIDFLGAKTPTIRPRSTPPISKKLSGHLFLFGSVRSESRRHRDYCALVETLRACFLRQLKSCSVNVHSSDVKRNPGEKEKQPSREAHVPGECRQQTLEPAKRWRHFFSFFLRSFAMCGRRLPPPGADGTRFSCQGKEEKKHKKKRKRVASSDVRERAKYILVVLQLLFSCVHSFPRYQSG